MPNVAARDLHALVKDILVAAGASETNAERMGEALVSSNMAGVDTHGVVPLALYVSQIKSGELVPTASPEIVKETANSALVRGNWTFGHVVAEYTMRLAIDKARDHDIGIASMMESGHIGRLGEYAEMAIAEGMIGLVLAGGYGAEVPTAVPFGGREAALHTNPVSMGFPAGDETPMFFDFATTTIAGTKANLAKNRGEQVPPGSMIDDEGNLTTDASGWPDRRALTAFGQHKGYAIMLANEVMGRILSDADSYADTEKGGVTMRHQGVTMIAIKADLFQPMARFGGRVDDLERKMRAVPPAKGFQEVLVPGDLEAKARESRSRDGVPVMDDIWALLTGLAEEFGVALPSVS